MGKIVLIMVILLSGIFITIMLTVNSRAERIPEMLSENYRDLCSYALNWGIKKVVSGNVTDSTLVVYDDFHVLDGRIESIEYVFSYGDSDSDAGYNITGDLNINPGTSENNEFQMQTPSGYIDRDQVHQGAPEFSYSGPASIVRVKPKAQGRTLTINGVSITLQTNTRYEITSTNMTVNLRNDKIKNGKAMGHWWIEIEATNATIDPDPGVTVDELFTDVVIKAEVSWIVNGETICHDAQAVLEVVTVIEGETEWKLVYWNPW